MTSTPIADMVAESMRLFERNRAIAKLRSSMFLYVIGRWQGPVKVGISSSPQSRLAQIRTGCPFKIEILHLEPMLDKQHAIWHESCFHDVYARERLQGEWFKTCADLAIKGIETGLQHEAWSQVRDRSAA